MRSITPSAVIVIAIALGLACARAPRSAVGPRPPDLHDRVYLAMRERDEGCNPRLRARCCPVLLERLQKAIADNQTAAAVTALDAMAIACPDMRDRAVAALDHHPEPSRDPEAGKVEVGYQAHIERTDRLYWVSAFVDGKQLAGTAVPAGPHALDVEIHVMTATGSASDALFRIRAHKELVLEPRATRFFLAALRRNETAGGDTPFTLELLEKGMVKPRTAASAEGEPPVPRAGPPAEGDAAPSRAPAEAAVPPPPAPPPTPGEPSPPPPTGAGARGPITGGKVKTMPRPRLPSELNRGMPWQSLIRVCVTSDGRVDSLMPLSDPPHPRLLGVLVDSLVHTEYHPLTVKGRTVPFCHPLNINISPG